MDELGGGTGTIVTGVTSRWDPARWRPVLVVPYPPIAHVPPGLDVRVLPPRPAWSRYPVEQVRRFLEIRRIALEVRPAIVHAYFFWSIIFARLLKAFGVVDVVVENREDQGFAWGRRDYFLLRRTRRWMDRVVCVSRAVGDTVLEREGLEPGRVTVVHNGIEPVPSKRADETEAKTRARFGIGPDELVVGIVAHLNRAVKGGCFLVDAVPLIVREVPDARIVVVGLVDDDLIERARVSGATEAMVFVGLQENVENAYQIMDVSVLTSLSEGLSMTLLESMRRGLPVVATDVGGNPEVVEDAITGFLVPPRDPAAFAERVVELLRDPPRRRAMGRAGQRRVAEHFAIERTAAAYQELYQTLTGC